jgi:hypothetical protein
MITSNKKINCEILKKPPCYLAVLIVPEGLESLNTYFHHCQTDHPHYFPNSLEPEYLYYYQVLVFLQMVVEMMESQMD